MLLSLYHMEKWPKQKKYKSWWAIQLLCSWLRLMFQNIVRSCYFLNSNFEMYTRKDNQKNRSKNIISWETIILEKIEKILSLELVWGRKTSYKF